MRISSSVTSVSWIPSEAITGAALKMPFEIGMAHYDAPPPDTITDIGAFVAADRCRFANQLGGWIEVDDGVIVDHGVTGMGRIGGNVAASSRPGDHLHRHPAARSHLGQAARR